MNKSLIIAVIFAFGTIACQSKETKEAESNEQHHDASATNSETMDVEAETKAGNTKEDAMNNLITEYLNLKNALTADNAKDAARFGEKIVSEISKFDVDSFTSEQKMIYDEVMDDALEQAEHIADNANNIAHQREHFAMLSRDVDDLLGVFGTSKVLYQDFCPMYENGKGAVWISEYKEIKNPYLGTKMLTCGSIKKEF
ncbi:MULTISPECIES: DUF3347 domain-containing protein [Algoriphagus]|uniref:DUF3347 domain-containing protein n=1 Tax=Algoriphagus boritolerans DSM 17298 = JCM 18970 TaxID=1120964 RepID=A0A1H5UBB9_9BACT|nr:MULTISPECIES: DUF3347 domain-containing protein [Algoriphagus]MBS4070499.1 DUF3347 domain-containing protein [Algoriphagus sp.]MDP2040866.1 DUF3347 domain-containing protein [Algoriphagus sp.]MDP3470809.1 DUF3347 domain-containing protein [Algoriphagus sp.]SEF72343.1 Protein of unknown function [Algoriphagus boritolerans DSM 17298 = JCM 18970]